MSFDWDLAKTFLTVAEEGTLSGAARALGQTQPTIGRQIAALEKSLDVTLFERTGRSIALTPFGIELLDHVRSMAKGADMVLLSAMGESQSIEGQVRITASELFCAFVLPPILRDLRTKAPLLEIDVAADNGVRDLTRREADIAIRHAMPEQPNLFTRRVRDEQMRFYASASYIEQASEPTQQNLSAHQIVSYVETERMLGYLLPMGLDLGRANFKFSSPSHFVVLEMVRNDFGVAALADSIASQFEDLVPVMSDLGPFDLPTWLVAHSEVKTSRRVRTVFDHLAEALG